MWLVRYLLAASIGMKCSIDRFLSGKAPVVQELFSLRSLSVDVFYFTLIDMMSARGASPCSEPVQSPCLSTYAFSCYLSMFIISCGTKMTRSMPCVLVFDFLPFWRKWQEIMWIGAKTQLKYICKKAIKLLWKWIRNRQCDSAISIHVKSSV